MSHMQGKKVTLPSKDITWRIQHVQYTLPLPHYELWLLCMLKLLFAYQAWYVDS